MDWPTVADRVELADLLKLRNFVRMARARRRPQQRTGAHNSQLLGRGLDFAGLRSYQPGDDVRHIDWRVLARSTHVYTREFHPEGQHNVTLALEPSAAFAFGSQRQSKFVFAHRLLAALAWQHGAQGDQVSIAGQRGAISKQMAGWLASDQHTWRLPRSGIAYIAVDIWHPAQALSWPGDQRNVVVLLIHDPLDAQLPTGAALPLVDSGKQFWIRRRRTDSAQWHARFLTQQQACMQILKRRGAQCISISCDQPLTAALAQIRA